MLDFLKIELRRVFKSRMLWIALFIGCLITVSQYFMNVLVFMYLFVKAIYETSPKYRKAALEEKKFRRQFSIHWIALAIQIILTYMLSMGYRSLIGFTQESVTAENLQMKFGIKKL